jgi:hypothetical protein
MTTQEQAQTRIAAAEKACRKIQKTCAVAAVALSGSLGVNGYGIFHDHAALRNSCMVRGTRLTK